MPPKTYGRQKSSEAITNSSSSSSKATTMAGGKKMSSLSSLQSTLKFTLPPSFKSIHTTGTNAQPIPTSTSTPSYTSTGLNLKSGGKGDREMMPPPPADYLTKTRARSRSDSPEKSRDITKKKKNVIVYGKGKGREIQEDEDDEIEILGSSPGKPRKGDEEMWTELYAPETIAELAPGKARVAKVKSWVHEAIHGYSIDAIKNDTSGKEQIRKYKRILLLSGPAGAGKTTTVRVIAKDLGVELMEWGEGADDAIVGAGVERESSTAKLISFLSRNSYSPLNIHTDNKNPSSSPHNTSSSPNGSTSTSAPRLILLTGLPNLSHHSTKEAFHAALLSFCQSYTTSSCPMIIVHSDAGSGGRAEESWMERERGGREGSVEVLGRTVKDGPWCQKIDFIPIAPTFITKALTSIIARHNSTRPKNAHLAGGGSNDPNLQLIAATCNGDLRSAINSLQMLKTGIQKKRKSSSMSDVQERKKLKGKGSRGGKGSKIAADEEVRIALDALTRKDQNLGLFHALGKIMYNKRLGDPGEDKEDQETVAVVKALPAEDILPDHLSAYTRRRSLIQVEEFLPTIPVDTSSLALWLHECTPKFINDVDQAVEAYEDLCRADIMRADDDIWQASPQAIAYALHLTVRGTLMALPSPVPRTNQKITKPQFFESYKSERTNISNLDTASAYITKKAIQSSLALSEKEFNMPATEGVWGGLCSRFNLAVEMVPMMIKIQNASGNPLLPSTVQSLALPPYTSFTQSGAEIDAKTDVDHEDDYEESVAGEDGLGQITTNTGVWDEIPDLPDEVEEDGAEGDEIEDFD